MRRGKKEHELRRRCELLREGGGRGMSCEAGREGGRWQGHAYMCVDL